MRYENYPIVDLLVVVGALLLPVALSAVICAGPFWCVAWAFGWSLSAALYWGAVVGGGGIGLYYLLWIVGGFFILGNEGKHAAPECDRPVGHVQLSPR